MERQAKRARDRAARNIAARAEATAPVLTGTYRDSLHVESDENESRVVSDVGYALAVEAREHTLARALAAERTR